MLLLCLSGVAAAWLLLRSGRTATLAARSLASRSLAGPDGSSRDDVPSRSEFLFTELLRIGRTVLLCAGALALAVLALTALLPGDLRAVAGPGTLLFAVVAGLLAVAGGVAALDVASRAGGRGGALAVYLVLQAAACVLAVLLVDAGVDTVDTGGWTAPLLSLVLLAASSVPLWTATLTRPAVTSR